MTYYKHIAAPTVGSYLDDPVTEWSVSVSHRNVFGAKKA